MTDRIMNMAIRHSNAIGVHTKGTGADYVANGNFAVGDTKIAVSTGTGTILSGDLISFAGDGNQYVSGGLDGTNLVLNKAGLLVPVVDKTGITLSGSYVPNVGFARSAIALATRAPALPEGGDSATDVTQITDPMTGLSFEIAVYKQYLQTTYHVRLAWGVKAIKQEHIGLLIG